MKQISDRLFGDREPRLVRDEQGVTMILWVLLIVGLLTIVAIVIDLGNARQEKRQLQNSADAAALAGAAQLYTAGDPCATAVSYTYNNMRLGAVQGSCTSGAYSQTVANNSVFVTTPYTLSGSTFPANQLINVKACRDVATTFARIINITSLHVCGSATARKTGGGGGPTPPGTDTSDAEAPCGVNDAFTPDGYFDKDHDPNPPNDPTADVAHSGTSPGGPVAEDQKVGATYWSTTDIDLTLNKPYFFLQNTTTGQKTTYTYVANNNPKDFFIQKMQKIDNVAVPANIFAYQIQWKIPKGNPTDNAYTVGMSVYDSASSTFPDGKCGKAQWTFVKGHPATSGTSTCGEDSFLGAIWVVDGVTGTKKSGVGATAKPGDYVGATYQDESAIFNPTDQSAVDAETWKHRIIFTDNGTVIPEDTPVTNNTKGPNTAHAPFTAGTPTDKFTLNSGTTLKTTSEKYSTDILWKLPATVANGTHTITLSAYDGDNNKTGGDCGVGNWTINVSGGSSDVMLVR